MKQERMRQKTWMIVVLGGLGMVALPAEGLGQVDRSTHAPCLCGRHCVCPAEGRGQVDHSTHESDHLEDEDVQLLETVHVHGLRLNKDRQRGPVPTFTPWPTIPAALRGKAIDDWMKVRFRVDKTATTRVMVLEPAHDRLLNLAGLRALNQWTFDPQMKDDEPVDGELTVRVHFRTR